MSEILFERFEISCRFESGREYAVIKPIAAERESVLNYQVKMLRYNPRPEMIQFEAVTKNGSPELLYDISDLRPVSGYATEIFRRLIRETASAIDEGGKLLLSESGFLLNEKYIYIDTATGCLRFIYIPFEITTEPYEGLKNFIRRLYGLCSGNGGAACLSPDIEDALNGSGSALIGRLLKISRVPGPEPSEINISEKEEETEIMEPESPDDGQKLFKAFFNLPVRVLAVIWAAAEIALFGLAYFIYKEYVSGLPAGTAAVTAVLIASSLGVGFLLARVLLPWFKPEVKESAAQTVDMSFLDQPDLPAAADRCVYETVMLGKSPRFRASLIPDGKNEDTVEYVLENDRCVVGRNAQFADIHIPDMTVGRMHAEINRKEDIWRIRDLGSKNGTKVNGEMLTGDEGRVLKDTDFIEFANVRYIFYIKVHE